MREIQEMYLSLAKKVLVKKIDVTSAPVERKYVTAFTMNMQGLGFMPTQELLTALSDLSYTDFMRETEFIMAALIELAGSRKNIRPMYPDFPEFVMNASDEELFWGAFAHWFTNFEWLPEYSNRIQVKTESLLACKPIDLGSEEDLRSYTYKLANSSVAMSETQREYLESLICRYFDSLDVTQFNKMSNKENIVFTIYTFYRFGHRFANILSMDYLKTSTDVLRLAMIMLGGDHTLASHNNDFKSLKRRDRRFILACLDAVCNTNKQTIEDAARYQGLWIIVGEQLHPGDYAKRYSKAYSFFTKLRNEKARSWYSKLEKAYSKKNLNNVIALLESRPGEFARNLERVLRLAMANKNNTHMVIESFRKVATQVDNTILYQLAQHFVDLAVMGKDIRCFMPKGNMAKVYSMDDERVKLSSMDCLLIATACNDALASKYSQLEPLGKVYIEDNLDGFALPLKLRNASKQMTTLARGSRIKVPDEAKVIRMYTYWKNPGHTDIDLSALFFDENWENKRNIAFHALRDNDLGAAHSGDIRSAVNGAAEYIDFDIEMCKKAGYRYVCMTINAFNGIPFNTMEECFGGVMLLEKAVPNERTFDPAKSLIRSDVTAEATLSVPMVFDLYTREVVWLDAVVTSRTFFNVASRHANSYINTVRGLLSASYPLFNTMVNLHVNNRECEIVEDKEEADVIFSLTEGVTPFSAEEINANWIK